MIERVLYILGYNNRQELTTQQTGNCTKVMTEITQLAG